MSIIADGIQRGKVQIWALKFQNRTVAAVAWLLSSNYAVYWFAPQLPEGKQINAHTILINAFIEKYAGSGKVIDFAGSDISSIAEFFKSWGAYRVSIPVVHWNKLLPDSVYRWISRRWFPS